MAAPCVRSTMTRSLRLLSMPATSASPCLRTLSSSARLRRPPSQPVAAEPAIVKAPHDPPNPAAWPGKQKARQGHYGSSETNQSGSSSKSPFDDLQGPWSTPASAQAESSKAAQARASGSASNSNSITLEEPSRPKKASEEPACSTLSPSSPAGPRTQSSLDKGKGKQEAAAGKALPPEETKKPAAGAASATKSAATGKLFRAKKAALSLTPTAVERLQELLESDSGPRLIRIGVRNKGCAGMSYHLEYVTPEQAGKFDERVKQDGVEVLIDSKALFSIIGSEMDWQEDKLSAKFVFNNPNVKESCGCGESFLT